MNPLLPLSLLALLGGNDDKVITSTLKFKVVKEWTQILPKDTWTDVGNVLPIRQNDLPGFVVDNQPNKLSVDTNADGKPDKDVKGASGFLSLRGKHKDGTRFPYAVRIRSLGDRWQFASSCIMTGKAMGETVTLYDLNNNNVWNEVGRDGISIGNTDCVSTLGRILNLSGELYTVEFSGNGLECSATPYKGESGLLSVAKSYESKGKLASAVFRNQAKDCYIDLASARKGTTVPTGNYVLDTGIVRRKKDSARIRTGKMSPILVESGKDTFLEWGGPVYMDYQERPGENPAEVLVYPPKFYGKLGEEYFSFSPAPCSPTIFVKDKRGKEIWSGKFCTS